ncbi:MAG: hypothetical protein L3J45_03710 [Flavobacteriaceae bacterium]|nr:hypothetical protein [Flavobacteriaceae bacterium]
MKGLDKYKEAWKNQDSKDLKYSYNDIQEMLHKKSSSIVKWIFYISLIEFCFWIVISFAFDTDWNTINVKSRLYMLLGILTAINYIIIILFIALFYKNYKTISVSSNAQKLMKDILKTRKTVYYYVLYNVGMLIFGFVVVMYYIFTSVDFLTQLQTARPESSLNSSLTLAIVISVVIIAVIVGLLLMFYRLIYGVLLKRLKQNYKELSES